MRTLVVFLLAVASLALAQTDRGTITGTIIDPAGAVVANAPLELKGVETGSVYPAVSSATGNYTFTQLPVGTYELTTTVPGFKKSVRSDITVNVQDRVRVDAALEVGRGH